MKHRLVVCHAVVAGALLGTAVAGWSAPAPTAGIFRYEWQVTQEGRRVANDPTTYYLKGRFSRVETVSPRGKYLYIIGPSGVFAKYPGRKE